MTKRFLARIQGKDIHELGHLSLFISGGVGGFSCWLFSYPQDVIKTKLQVAKEIQFANLSPLLRDGGFYRCGSYIYHKEGFWGFWRGFSACSARAVIANSFMFMAYEFAQRETRGLIEND